MTLDLDGKRENTKSGLNVKKLGKLFCLSRVILKCSWSCGLYFEMMKCVFWCVQVRMWCSRAWGRVCWTTPSWATTPASLLMDRQVRVKNLGNIRSSSILLLAWVLKVKLSPKCNLGLLCECIWGQTDFQWECYGHFYNSIKICIFKTVRSLDTTWNFAGSITRVSTHQHQHWQHCLCAQSH